MQSYMGKPTMIKRGIWFFMRTVLIITFIVALCVGVFLTAMEASNLYILATEGLQLRAECVLMEGDRISLAEYYTGTFIDEDEKLNSAVYDDYDISSFELTTTLEGISVLPWSTTAYVTVVERVEMNGSIKEEAKGENPDGEFPLPDWEPGRYAVRFIKHEGRWYIYQMQLLDAAPTLAPLPTYDPSMTPIPWPTATPEVTQ